jgi:hypothetical protein
MLLPSGKVLAITTIRAVRVAPSVAIRAPAAGQLLYADADPYVGITVRGFELRARRTPGPTGPAALRIT